MSPTATSSQRKWSPGEVIALITLVFVILSAILTSYLSLNTRVLKAELTNIAVEKSVNAFRQDVINLKAELSADLEKATGSNKTSLAKTAQKVDDLNLQVRDIEFQLRARNGKSSN